MKNQIENLDFLFVYEHKVRELENLCLMKYELDKRGYKSKIVHIEDAEILKAMRPIYHARVVVMMACYTNRTIEWHTKNYVIFDKLIDLQWENIVFPMDEKNKKAYKNYSGLAKDVVRVSWGEMNRTRMLKVVGMDPRKVKLIGHVGMDFLRDELRGYYLSKNDVLDKYGILPDKKIFLFVSPYFSDNYMEKDLRTMCSRFGEGWGDYYSQCMIPSKHIILGWMEKICEQREDIIFIYRPHPGEFSEAAERMEKKFANFKVIEDLSVKQWILISDKIYTGNSSSFVEAYFAKKMCHLLFPIPVPKDYELFFFKDADKITSFDEFLQTIKENDYRFPVREELIADVYSIDWEKPSYIKFADMAEEVLNDSYYDMTKEQKKIYYDELGIKKKITRFLLQHTPLYDWYLAILDCDFIQLKWVKNQREKRKKWEESAYDFEKTSDQEITDIISRIACELENKH